MRASKMARRLHGPALEGLPPELPKYVLRYLHRRVRWSDGHLHYSGVVTEVTRTTKDHKQRIVLRVARDDGFLSPSVDAQDVYEIQDYGTPNPE